MWVNSVLIVLTVALVLVWYHEVHYMTASAPDYMQTATAWLAALTGAVTWLSGIGWGLQYVYNRLRQRPDPKKLTREQVMEKYLPAITDKVLWPVLRSFWLTTLLLAVAGGIAYAAFYVGPPFLPPGGPIIVSPSIPSLPYTRNQKHVYVAVEQTDARAGGLAVFNERAVELKEQFIPLGDKEDKSEPSCIAVAPSKGKLFVTDLASSRVYVIDEDWNAHAVAVGWKPRCVAISPDERKAYVANVEPAPYGTISVLDIDRETVSHTINEVNCPSGLAVSRDGRRLYVATECGGGHDPLLVIDTATDKVVATIPNIEIGRAPAVSPDGRRLFVARVNVDRPNMRRFLLSVFSTVNHQLIDETSFDQSIQAIAVSPDLDKKFLYVAVGRVVKILNGENVQEQRNQIQTCGNQGQLASGGCVPTGLAVSDRGAIYILKADGTIQFSGLTGLLNPGKP